MRWHRAISIFLVMVIVPTLAFGQSRLDEVRHDANGTDAKPAEHKSKESKSNSSSDDDDDLFGFGQVFAEILFAPFKAPRAGLHDEWDSQALFPSYPYAERPRGYLFFPDHDNGSGNADETINVRPWSLRLSAEEGNDFRRMNRVGIRASLDTSLRIGLQSNWNYLSESLDGGRRDSTWLGDNNVTFRFAQGEKAQFYTGAGVRVLTDPTATHAGFNLLYGADFFPRKPVTASALFDLGNVGSAFILHGRATIGATWRHLEGFAGYDFMRIGSVNVQGPLLGLRFWY